MRPILSTSLLASALLALTLSIPAGLALAQDKPDAPQALTEPGGVDSRLHDTGAKPAPRKDQSTAKDDAAEQADAAKRRELTKDDPPSASTPTPKPADTATREKAPKPFKPTAEGTTKPVDAPQQADAAKPTRPAEPASKSSDTSKEAGATNGADGAQPRKGRVGALSPDEQRRAARSRERAEAARKPAAAPERPVRDAEKHEQAKTVSLGKATEGKPSKQDALAEPSHPSAAEPAARERADAPKQTDRQQTVTQTQIHRKRTRAYSANRPRGEARGPRVGDVVPEGVPLYPLPPGYDRPPRRSLAGRGPWAGEMVPPYPVPPPGYRADY